MVAPRRNKMWWSRLTKLEKILVGGGMLVVVLGLISGVVVLESRGSPQSSGAVFEHQSWCFDGHLQPFCNRVNAADGLGHVSGGLHRGESP